MTTSFTRARAAAGAQHDQALAILAAASAPMSVREICAEMPLYWSIHCDSTDQCEHELRNSHWRRFEHLDGRCFLLMDCPSCVLGVRLTALRKAGMVTREGWGGAVKWSFSGSTIDLSHLEGQFADIS